MEQRLSAPRTTPLPPAPHPGAPPDMRRALLLLLGLALLGAVGFGAMVAAQDSTPPAASRPAHQNIAARYPAPNAAGFW